WVSAVSTRWEDVRPKDLVKRLQHLADAKVLDLVDGLREVAPEIPQNVFPLQLAVGDEVQLLLEIGREVVFHIPAEETFEECCHQPPLVLRDEALLFEAHVRSE